MVALVDVLGAFLTDHQSKDKDDGSNGNGWDERQNRRHNTYEANDQINDSVHEGVASKGSNALVDGVADVDDSAKRRSKDGTKKRSDSITDHGLANGVWVSSLLGGYEAHHVSKTSSD